MQLNIYDMEVLYGSVYQVSKLISAIGLTCYPFHPMKQSLTHMRQQAYSYRVNVILCCLHYVSEIRAPLLSLQ